MLIPYVRNVYLRNEGLFLDSLAILGFDSFSDGKAQSLKIFLKA